jgi:pilus assembly protein CpaC
VITPRGTIRLQVAPEVSALDYANAVIFEGFTIPALSTRKIQTEVELENGQSFVIAGLLDNTMTETLSRIPGLANIPLLGKLFQSRTRSKKNTELLVIVTPEVVRPIPVGQPVPELNYPQTFLKSNSSFEPRQPGIDKTGPVAEQPSGKSIPIEQLVQQPKPGQAATAPNLDVAPPQPPAVKPVQAPPPAGGSGGNDK